MFGQSIKGCLPLYTYITVWRNGALQLSSPLVAPHPVIYMHTSGDKMSNWACSNCIYVNNLKWKVIDQDIIMCFAKESWLALLQWMVWTTFKSDFQVSFPQLVQQSTGTRTRSVERRVSECISAQRLLSTALRPLSNIATSLFRV